MTDGSGRASPGFDSAVATGKGDDGTTGLLYGGDRIAKDDPRAELGLKQELDVVPRGLAGIAELILRLQRELFVAAAELATNPDAWDRLQDGTTRVSAAMVEGLDALLRDLESHVEMPREFVVPGESRTSAAIEVARTTVRRAERRAVTLRRDGLVPGTHLVPYLNRLADLLWVLARAVEQAESRRAPPSRPGRRRGSGARTEEN